MDVPYIMLEQGSGSRTKGKRKPMTATTDSPTLLEPPARRFYTIVDEAHLIPTDAINEFFENTRQRKK